MTKKTPNEETKTHPGLTSTWQKKPGNHHSKEDHLGFFQALWDENRNSKILQSKTSVATGVSKTGFFCGKLLFEATGVTRRLNVSREQTRIRK